MMIYTCTQLYGANPSCTAVFRRQVYLRLVTEITDATNIIFIAEVEASGTQFRRKMSDLLPENFNAAHRWVCMDDDGGG